MIAKYVYAKRHFTQTTDGHRTDDMTEKRLWQSAD